MHTFKRIRYLSGTLMPESPAFAIKKEQPKAPNKQAENTAPNLPKKFVLDQPAEKETTVLKEPVMLAPKMARSLRKSVKISDEGFLTSLKRQLSKKGHSIESILANEMPQSQG